MPAVRYLSTHPPAPARLEPGPIRHEALLDDLIVRIKAVQVVFAEVDSTPQERWIEDFRRDLDPEREVVIWEAMARAYGHCTAGHDLPLAKRKELFGILLIGSGAGIEDALAHLELKEFSREEARGVLEAQAREFRKSEPPRGR